MPIRSSITKALYRTLEWKHHTTDQKESYMFWFILSMICFAGDAPAFGLIFLIIAFVK